MTPTVALATILGIITIVATYVWTARMMRRDLAEYMRLRQHQRQHHRRILTHDPEQFGHLVPPLTCTDARMRTVPNSRPATF